MPHPYGNYKRSGDTRPPYEETELDEEPIDLPPRYAVGMSSPVFEGPYRRQRSPVLAYLGAAALAGVLLHLMFGSRRS